MHGGHCHGSHCHSGVSGATYAVIGATAASSGSRGRSEEGSCNPWCPSCGYLRYLVLVLATLGCAIDYLLRFTLSVAIVAMTNTTSTKDSINKDYVCPAAINATADAQSTTGGGEFHWTGQQQAAIQGVFFLGYIFTKGIGGRLAEVVGARAVAGLSVGLSGLLSLLSPTAAELHPYALAAVRLLMGILLGPFFPAGYSIVGRWTAPGEAGKMISVAYSGVVVGLLVSLGCSGYVIKAFGWRWVFWGSGILALLWVPFWTVYVRNSPRQHPGISPRELQLLSANHSQPRRKVPWSRLLRWNMLYVLVLMEFAGTWLQGFIATDIMLYITNQIGLNFNISGKLNIVTSVLGGVASLFYGWLSDLIIRREWLSVANTRKMVQGVGIVLLLVSSLGLVASGCSGVGVSVALLVMPIALAVATVTFLVTPLDVVPNYCGTIIGLIGLADVAGFVAPMVFSYMIPLKHGWNLIILMNAVLYTVSGSVYIIFVTDEEVEWNLYQEVEGEDHAAAGRKRKDSDITNGHVTSPAYQ